MPPKGEPLTPQEIGKLRGWIDQGAKPPAEPKAATQLQLKSNHWAFQPIQQPRPPTAKNANWVKNPIDAFVLARLEKERLTPSPEADRRAQIRRLYLDLLGLPPRPEDVDEFLFDTAAGAYERLVERVLASP